MRKPFNPADYIGWTEKNFGAMSQAMQKAIEEMKQREAIKQQQEMLLGDSVQTSDEEREIIKKRIMEGIRGY